MRPPNVKKSRLPLRVMSGLLLAAYGMLSACGEPKPLSNDISSANPPVSPGALQPDLPLALPTPPTYQAQAGRNPFFWDSESTWAERVMPSPVIHGVTSGLSFAHKLDAESGKSLEECELASLPALILRATFSGHSELGTAASALIQVADGEVYAVSLGQRLIVKPTSTVINPLNAELNKELNKELGTITAINTQNITLKQHLVKPQRQHDGDASSPECRQTQLLTLHLYD